MTTSTHPFAAQRYGDLQTYSLTAADRIDHVKRMTSVAQLQAALEVDGLQKTVERAIRAKLKKIGAAS